MIKLFQHLDKFFGKKKEYYGQVTFIEDVPNHRELILVYFKSLISPDLDKEDVDSYIAHQVEMDSAFKYVISVGDFLEYEIIVSRFTDYYYN